MTWLERLRSHSPDGLEFRAGASEPDIAEVENALGHQLPKELRALLAETNGFDDRAGQWEVMWSAGRIAVETLQWRQRNAALMGFVCFGDDGAGDLFLQCTNDESTHVWNDIDGRSYLLAPSLGTFWGRLAGRHPDGLSGSQTDHYPADTFGPALSSLVRPSRHSEDLVDRVLGDRGGCWVGGLVVGEREQCGGQRPASSTCPGVVIDRQRVSEEAAGVGGEQVPRDDQVASGIAHAETPKVDNRAEPTFEGKQVPWLQVSVDPNGWLIPWRCAQGGIPCCGYRVDIEDASEIFDCRAGEWVS